MSAVGSAPVPGGVPARPATSTGGGAKHLAGVAGKSYNVASVWEQSATLSEEQLAIISALNQACSQRPIPQHVVDDRRAAHSAEQGGHAEAGQPKTDSYEGTLEDAVLRNTNQFHKWHAELDAACALEMEEKYKRYADLLNSHLSSCEAILGQVQQTLDLFETLFAQHREVEHRSKTLYSSCEQIVREKDQLQEFADALHAKLKFFDEFEAVYSQFNQAQLSTSLDNEQFLSLLKKLDDCKSYVATNPQYADSSTYMAKFRQLQARAMGAVRTKVQQVLKHATQQVQAAIQEAAAAAGGAPGAPVASGGKPSALAEGAEVSLLYVRFRAAAEPSLKGLFREIEGRCMRPEYQRLLEECQALYCQSRLQLISPFVQQRVEALAAQALPLLARNGCEHLLRVGQLEAQLFEHFFSPPQPGMPGGPPGSANGHHGSKSNGLDTFAGAAGGHQQQQQQQQGYGGHGGGVDRLVPVMEPLCGVLYDVLRPLVVQLQDIDELCELVDILKHEVLGDQLKRRGPGAEALVPTLTRTLADVQARLIFRCQAFIKEEVSSHSPSPADLDYPGKLQRAAEEAEKADAEGLGQEGAETGASGVPGEVTEGGDTGTKASAQYQLLYPPVHSTLVCLSKLYRAVDTRIFGGLAQDAVSACTLSIQQAARLVAQRSTPLDAQLFTIRHLLFLREQIAPFDVDFAASDIDLDFTHMRDHMKRILSGEVSLFAMSSSNAIVRMLGTGGPRVLHYKVDSKKELEKQLKSVCESVIMALTKTAVEPLLGFITKVTAVRVAAAANPANARPIREQAFASPAKLAEMVTRVNEGLAGPLSVAVARMRLYLPNPSTHAILFKPVKSNLVEAHAQVLALLQAEYTPEEAAAVPIKQPAELNALLDALG